MHSELIKNWLAGLGMARGRAFYWPFFQHVRGESVPTAVAAQPFSVQFLIGKQRNCPTIASTQFEKKYFWKNKGKIEKMGNHIFSTLFSILIQSLENFISIPNRYDSHHNRIVLCPPPAAPAHSLPFLISFAIIGCSQPFPLSFPRRYL